MARCTTSRIAVSVTLKSDGTKKDRFILDALRNGTNGLIQVQKRIVLPRAHDVVTDLFDLLGPLEPPFESIGKMDWGAELLVVVLGVILALRAAGAVHLGVDNLGVVCVSCRSPAGWQFWFLSC